MVCRIPADIHVDVHRRAQRSLIKCHAHNGEGAGGVNPPISGGTGIF